jgi:hypothetical protein
MAYGAAVVLFLAMVASYYSRDTGFTVFLSLPANSHTYELPVVQAIPHAHNEVDGGYDGQFYAQLAVDPLLRDPAIDRAMDRPGYRTHRILFSWTAWAMGLGRPAWSLHAYAIQNVIAWVLLAWLLCVWCPPRDARTFVLWAGALFTHGVLTSVRNALPDAPRVLLTALAVLAADRGRPWVSAIVTGIAGLARETNILAGVALWRRRPNELGGEIRRTRAEFASELIRSAVAALICILPLALWLDYLRSLYGADAFSGGGHITVPLSGLWWKVQRSVSDVAVQGFTVMTVANWFSLAGFGAQVVALAWCTRARKRTAAAETAWLQIAWVFLALGVFAHRVVWDGSPGAFTRVILPFTVGVNVLLARSRRAPWALIVAANLGVVSGLMAFLFGWV